MKNPWIAALLLGLACAAGAQQQKSAPTPTIYVDVADGRIAVSPSGMKTPTGQTTITWWLRTSGYRFASGGVSFGDANSYFNCSLVNNGQGVRCTKSEQAPSGEIPYSLRVQGDGETVGSDPGIFIQNE
jgi:hypothetical protein